MPKKKGKKKGKKKSRNNNNNNTGVLAKVPVLLVPEIHRNAQNIMRNKDAVMSYVVKKQRQRITRICFVSEGNVVNPIFESLIAVVGSGQHSQTVDYIKDNLLVETLNNEKLTLHLSGHEITTLPVTMNRLVEFIAQFFQDYGALVYQMGYPNTPEGFKESMEQNAGITNVEKWFDEGGGMMIQHLKESRQNGLLNEEGNASAELIIVILQQFKDGGLRILWSIRRKLCYKYCYFSRLLELIKTLIINSTGDSFDDAGKLLLPGLIKKILDGLVT